MKKAIQYFKNYLIKNQLRFTKQRQVILKLFLEKEGHFCVDELYYVLRRKFPQIGYTTVYRTLKLLNKAELARELDFYGKTRKYEHQFDQPHHDHLICVRCGNQIEVFDKKIEDLQIKLTRQYHFKPINHRLDIFGYCKECKDG